jgi:hypothetical protein
MSTRPLFHIFHKNPHLIHRQYKYTKIRWVWQYNRIVYFGYPCFVIKLTALIVIFGLVVRVPCYRSRVPGSIPGASHIFWEVVGLERGPLSLVSTIKEILGRKSSGSCLENLGYDRRDSSRWPRVTLYPQKLVLTLPTSGGRSVGIVRSRILLR